MKNSFKLHEVQEKRKSKEDELAGWVVAPTVHQLVLKGERMMHALCNSHMVIHELSPRQFFRASYMWKFQRDIPELSLANDCKRFDELGITPPYTIDYLIHVYGAQ